MRAKSGAIALWAGIGLVFGAFGSFGRAQPGPEDGGAVLRTPFDEPTPRAPSKSQAPSASPQTRNSDPGADQILANLTVDPRYAMNRDFQPTPDVGPWMICVHSYVTKEAPEWARQMAGELRGNPKYRLPAYVFTYGLEERHREYERVKHLLDRQREALKGQDLPFLYASRKGDAPDVAGAGLSEDLPLAYAMRLLKVQHIPVQCAVLVGGYANEDAANRALQSIKKLSPPDPNKVKLDTKFYTKADPKNPKATSGEQVYANPFERAFICRNPSIRQERAADNVNDGMDMNLLRRLNSGEPYTLLNCKKPITLAIKQFQTFTTVQSKDEPSNILQDFGFKTRAGEGIDQAAHDAHTLADLLRKNKQLEAYVLHTKYSSIVTIGGYDRVDDPALLATQNALGGKLREWDRMQFFPKPMPMKVPH